MDLFYLKIDNKYWFHPTSLKCNCYRCATKTYDNLLVGTQKNFYYCYKYIGGVWNLTKFWFNGLNLECVSLWLMHRLQTFLFYVRQ